MMKSEVGVDAGKSLLSRDWARAGGCGAAREKQVPLGLQPFGMTSLMFYGRVKRALLYAELFHFLVVVLAVKDVPLLAAFEDGALLALDLQARGLVNSRLLVQQGFENLADFEANAVAVFDEIHFVEGGESVGDGVRQLIYFVVA